MTDRIAKIRNFLIDSPKDCFLNHALALELIKEGKDEEAHNLFEQNLENDPLYVATYYHLAKLLERNQEYAQAIEFLEKGMKVAKEIGDQHSYNELQGVYDELV